MAQGGNTMENRIAKRRRGTLCVVGLLAAAALAVGDDSAIVRWTIDGGGVMRGAGGNFELSGTIGQPDACRMNGGGFDVAGGFWFVLAPSDCNDDGGVDLGDYGEFESCLAGPATDTPTGCKCFDVNRSGTVDLLDFAVVQSTFTGS